jgi:hypothetical protein
MEDSERSAEQISKYIEEHRGSIAPKSDESRTAIDHGTITRFINNANRSHSRGVEILYNFLVYIGKIIDPDIVFSEKPHADQLYRIIHNFFGVRETNDKLCHSIVGTYQLYFLSEERRNHVVKGAMTFEYDNSKSCFKIFEHQENKKQKLVEDWEGYYYARKERLIILLRGMGERLDNIPKFYILRTPYPNKNGVSEQTIGRMIKLGTDSAIFDMPVLLQRDDDALKKCDVVPNREIAGDILHEILAARVS